MALGMARRSVFYQDQLCALKNRLIVCPALTPCGAVTSVDAEGPTAESSERDDAATIPSKRHLHDTLASVFTSASLPFLLLGLPLPFHAYAPLPLTFRHCGGGAVAYQQSWAKLLDGSARPAILGLCRCSTFVPGVAPIGSRLLTCAFPFLTVCCDPFHVHWVVLGCCGGGASCSCIQPLF